MKKATSTLNDPVLPAQTRAESQGEAILEMHDVSKTFTMHLRGGVSIPVLTGVSLSLSSGECLAVVGPSGVGKSSLLRMVYANYRCDSGSIRVRHENQWVELNGADPRVVRDVRRRTIGYVSQFLRVIPRVSTRMIVAAAGRDAGLSDDDSERRSASLLEELNIPARLWGMPPATFSGGEQQRVNIARGLIGGHKVLLLDEPTASLDEGNRDVVIDLIRRAKATGTAIIGIFHDIGARERVADRALDLAAFAPATKQ